MTMDTAYWIAAVRAREAKRQDQLFDDPWARDLAGERGFAMMAASERASGGENAFIPVRVRWFDDLITATAPRVRQVVLLGAGLDTRAFRLGLPADLDWYEVDHHEVLTAKDKVLAGCAPRCRRHVVTGSVGGDWGPALLRAGLDPGARTLWVAEGLLFYLAEQTITGMLRDAARLCPPGSVLAADVMGTAGFGSPAMRSYRARCARDGMPPPFGTDDPVALLADGGWRPRRVTAPGGPDANYGRLPPHEGGLVPGSPHLIAAQRHPVS